MQRCVWIEIGGAMQWGFANLRPAEQEEGLAVA
jgi:hypothetical protein